MNNTFGFIGCGNMGGSLATAVCKSVGSDKVFLADKNSATLDILADKLNCEKASSLEIAEKCKYIFLGVKPQVLAVALGEIKDTLRLRNDRFILVSMLAGTEISAIKEELGFDCPVIRIMPNTPVSVGQGMIVYSPDENVFMDEIGVFCESLKYAGDLDRIEEKLINAATAVSGCGPAFVYLFAEAMADAGVECGLPRKKALQYATKTILGAGELMMKTAKHPAVLKDEVCSPAGSTIVGVHTLESDGFRGTVMSAVKSAFDKTNKL